MTSFLFAALLASTATCGGSTAIDGSPGPEAGEGEGEGEVETGPNLFSCDLAIDCTQDIGHLGEGLTDDQLRCGGEVLASGRGVVEVTSVPGPYPTLIETLTVLTADGRVFTQTRSRCGEEGACMEQNTTAWKHSALGECELYTEGADVTGCDTPSGACSWMANTQNCVDVPGNWTCDALGG